MEVSQKILNFLQLTVQDFWMILICIPVVLVVLKVIAKSIWEPHLKLLEEREAATLGASTAAQEKLKEAQRMSDEYEQRLTDARIQAMKAKLEKVDEAKRQAAEVVSNAETQGQHLVRTSRDDIAGKLSAARAESMNEVDSLVELAVQKLKTPGSLKEASRN